MPNMLMLMVAALVATPAAAQKQLPVSSDLASSSSGNSVAGAISAAGMTPRQAAALRYTINTFHTGPWSAPKTIDWQNTARSVFSGI